VPGAGVDDQQAGGARDLSGLAGQAVEQQRVALAAQQRSGLVHDPGRDADELVLGAAGDGGQLGTRKIQAGQ